METPIPVLLTVRMLSAGGNERDLSKLARYLDPRRYAVHVGAFHLRGERLAELKAAGLPLMEMPVRSYWKPGTAGAAWRFRDYIRRHGIQIVQAFDLPTSIFVVPVARFAGVPAVISSHLYFRHLIGAGHRLALRMIDRLAHRTIVNANRIQEDLVRTYGLPPERLFVCHNGVETSVFFPPPEPRPAGAGSPVTIGTLCLFREEKRVDCLLEAFARIAGAHPEAQLLIVGDGPMREPWMQLRSRLGLENRCRFELTTEDVPRWLRSMDIFVLPSRSEGFPNALLEAMACGCAPVASDVGGIPEMVEDGRTGFLFPPQDVAALAAKLDLLVRDSGVRERLGRQAAREARERFSMEATAARMQALYDDLLRGR